MTIEAITPVGPPCGDDHGKRDEAEQDAQPRWIRSTQACVSPRGGRRRPWHSGQSGQRIPEPVPRTAAPMHTIT